MDRLGAFLDSLVKSRYEEDFVDRLNYKVTAYILIAAALTISAKVCVSFQIYSHVMCVLSIFFLPKIGSIWSAIMSYKQ